MGFTLNQLEQERQIRKLQKKEDKDTSNYEQLSHLPKINNVELKGDKTTSDLGINADNVMMSDGVTSVEEAVNGAAKKAETATDITMTPVSGITINSSRIMKMDKLVIAQLKIKWSTPTMDETEIITFNGFNVGENYAVGVVTDVSTNTIGSFVLSGRKLFIRLSESEITSDIVLCMTVIGFTT
jgi:hypothetical protein